MWWEVRHWRESFCGWALFPVLWVEWLVVLRYELREERPTPLVWFNAFIYLRIEGFLSPCLWPENTIVTLRLRRLRFLLVIVMGEELGGREVRRLKSSLKGRESSIIGGKERRLSSSFALFFIIPWELRRGIRWAARESVVGSPSKGRGEDRRLGLFLRRKRRSVVDRSRSEDSYSRRGKLRLVVFEVGDNWLSPEGVLHRTIVIIYGFSI